MTVSIIIPIYNVANYIGDCLNSVLNQSYNNIEVVLVDDCTPDDSMKVAVPYIAKLRERFGVSVIKHSTNGGLSAARNTGVKNSTGDWLYFLDSDDEITNNCIELLVEKVNKYPTVDFVIGGVQVIGSDMTFPILCPEYISSATDLCIAYVKRDWYVMAVNKLLNKKFFIDNELWFSEGLFHEDELFSFMLSHKAHAMASLSEATYIYKMKMEGTITTNKKYKNYTDQLKIRCLCFDYLKNKNNIIGEWRGISIINYSYCFIMEVLNGTAITLREKKELIAKQLLIFKDVQSLCDSMPLSSKVKKFLLLSPQWVVRCFVKSHLLLLKYLK